MAKVGAAGANPTKPGRPQHWDATLVALKQIQENRALRNALGDGRIVIHSKEVDATDRRVVLGRDEGIFQRKPVGFTSAKVKLRRSLVLTRDGLEEHLDQRVAEPTEVALRAAKRAAEQHFEVRPNALVYEHQDATGHEAFGPETRVRARAVGRKLWSGTPKLDAERWGDVTVKHVQDAVDPWGDE